MDLNTLFGLLIFLLALLPLVGAPLIVFLPERGGKNASAFADLEKQAATLRARVRTGEMAEAECKQRLKEVMRQDDAGQWWMVGYESGQWYRHDGNDWARAEPPGVTTSANKQRGLAIVILVLGFVLGCGLGYGLFLWSGTIHILGGRTEFIALESRNYVGFAVTALVFAGAPLGFAAWARRLWWGK